MSKNNKNSYSVEEKELFEQYNIETGKQAIWKGKATNGFKQWKEELKNKPAEVEIEIPEYDETEEMTEAVQENQDIEKAIDELDEIFDDEEEESEPEEKPKKAKKPKKARVDKTNDILEYMGKNKSKWYSHRDFEKIGMNGRQVRPYLVRLLNSEKVTKKSVQKRNFYRLI